MKAKRYRNLSQIKSEVGIGWKKSKQIRTAFGVPDATEEGGDGYAKA